MLTPLWRVGGLALFCTIPPMQAQETLRQLAEAKGKRIGTGVVRDFIAKPDGIPAAHRGILEREFNLLVATDSMKMSSLLPKRPADPFRVRVSDLYTEPIDNLAAIARANSRQKIRGHVLIWHKQVPPWLVSESGTWSSAQITAFATSYIHAVLTYCRDKAPDLYEWDVVNEAIDGNPATWRSGTWYDGVENKQAFIDECFRAARAADPGVRLIYNDYRTELQSGGSKNAFLLEMVAGMVKRRIPIDGVGLQCHFTGPDADGKGGFHTKNAEAFARTFQSLHRLGLDGIVTELDLRLPTDNQSQEGKVTHDQLEAQGRQYELLAHTALSQPNCPALLVWGFSDGLSWVQKHFPGSGHPLPWDHACRKKPAYDGLAAALKRLPDPAEGN